MIWLGELVQAIRYGDQFASNFYRESAGGRMFRFGKSLESRKHMLTQGCGEGSGETGIERVHRRVVYRALR